MRFRELELVEPLRSHPIKGALYGGVLGALFGLMSGGKAFPTSWGSQALGYTLGFAAGGLIIGAALPLFRRRWVSGIVVAAATGVGLSIAEPFWREGLAPPIVTFIALCHGFAYAALLWRAPEPESAPLLGSSSSPGAL